MKHITEYMLIALISLNPLLVNASGGDHRNEVTKMNQVPEYLNSASTLDELVVKLKPLLPASDLEFFRTFAVKFKNAKFPKIEASGARWTIKNKENNLTIEVNLEKKEFTVAGKKVSIKPGANLESVYESVRGALPKNKHAMSIDFSLIPNASAQAEALCLMEPWCAIPALIGTAAFGVYLVWQDHKDVDARHGRTCLFDLHSSLRADFLYKTSCDKNHNLVLEFARKADVNDYETSLVGEAEYWVRREGKNVFYGTKDDPSNSKNNAVNRAVGSSDNSWTTWAADQMACLDKIDSICPTRDSSEPTKARRTQK